ncbi:cilia- and flagella-associated protein 36 isoform X3 [Coccinella septempunctata]|uniref:cilia- and flagella-associated protein 36 isoform X3 n=1 Tax=Coccinella septempunctata TaxID=41139 RepID=UPI001D07CD0A|nr:cilia- and flagella-associated protein 36 isoform X3 [Coccinella septempunctata]
MAEDENSWVFDSLVCFLRGPIWDAPIQNFIEEKSLIFEPNNAENEDDYQKIFDEYKNLVDFMLGNFMEDVGITPAQFEYASFKTRQHHHSLRFDQSTFEQIWAANNYEMFKRMMTRRNIDLQLQALELIERKYGKLPQSLILSQKETDVRVESQHKEICPKSGETEDIEKVILDEVAKKFIEEEPSDTPEIESLLEEKQVLESTRDEITSEMPTSGTELSIAHEISDGQLVPGGFNKD